jgi:hypothetical protein
VATTLGPHREGAGLTGSCPRVGDAVGDTIRLAIVDLSGNPFVDLEAGAGATRTSRPLLDYPHG